VLEPVGHSRGLGLGAAGLALVAAVAFLVGLAVGGRASPPPTQLPTASPPPAFIGPRVSQELHLAYLDVIGGQGWALCSTEPRITCRPAYGPPNVMFANFGALPETVSDADWALLSPVTVAPGRYFLAGPMPLTGPQATLARVGPTGTGTIIGPDDQALVAGVLWSDLGNLSAGRYVEIVTADSLAGVPDGHVEATFVGFAIGLVVAP